MVETHVVALDTKKAFDRVSHFSIFNNIKGRNRPRQLMDYESAYHINKDRRRPIAEECLGK